MVAPIGRVIRSTTGTIASTWRLRNHGQEIAAALRRLVEKGGIMPCALENPGGRDTLGWIRREDRELAARLVTVRPRRAKSSGSNPEELQ